MQWFVEMVAESKRPARQGPSGPSRELPIESTPTHHKPNMIRFDSHSRLVSSNEPRTKRYLVTID